MAHTDFILGGFTRWTLLRWVFNTIFDTELDVLATSLLTIFGSNGIRGVAGHMVILAAGVAGIGNSPSTAGRQPPRM